jgi:Mn-dependent DtxR family transcriptional regulator
MIKLINLKDLLPEILDGSYEIFIGIEKKGDNTGPSKTLKKAVTGKKRGRKPKNAPVKEKTQKKTQKKSSVPAMDTKAVLDLIKSKEDGITIKDLSKSLDAKIPLVRKALQTLKKEKTIEMANKRYFLKSEKPKKELGPPVPAEKVLEFLSKNAGSTLEQITQGLKESTFRRLVPITRKLTKEGKIRKDGKNYSIA